MKNQTNKPIAVLISDIHYNIQNLEVADAAVKQALNKATELNVPLIVAGDLHDTKANMRGECVKTMLDTFSSAQTEVIILVGNHDRINERSTAHSLEFLRTVCTIVDKPSEWLDWTLLPYHHEVEQLRSVISGLPTGSKLIMHQGIEGSHSGDYIQDRSALKKEDGANFRVISGHYHRRQTIKCRPLPRCIAGSFNAIREEHALHASGVGTWDYIGNPYTTNFGESNDPEKGFQVLYRDGSLEFIPTKLRKHVVISLDRSWIHESGQIKENDIVWIKIKDSKEGLADFSKKLIQENLGFKQDFRLDLIPDDTEFVHEQSVEDMSQLELLEATVNSVSDISDKRKTNINNIWKWMLEK